MNNLNIDLICEMFERKPKSYHKQLDSKLYQVAVEHWKQIEEAILGLCQNVADLEKENAELKNFWHETTDAIPNDCVEVFCYTKEDKLITAKYEFDRDKWISTNVLGGIDTYDKDFILRWKYKQ